ncbi:tRNA (guanine(6)-N(2))-methyltransferase THUMP3 [Petromyzon marinus]|uniref:tRNA (guanine(6)-N(2))-methyltransferase THUMP3 n=1 Tax=Petromyzon marinus TaxID=7757 RepID=UPI003F726AF0
MDGEQSSGETSAKVPAGDAVQVTIGATVPTGFEGTAADEVSEKIGVEALVSKDRGRITFVVPSSELREVHQLRSVDNLFVVVEEFQGYQFKENKEEALADFTALPSKLSWDIPLGLWRQNNDIKRKKTHGQRRGQPQGQQRGSVAKGIAAPGATGSVEDGVHRLKVHDSSDATGRDEQDAAAAALSATTAKEGEDVVEAGDTESPASGEDVAAPEEPEELPGGDGGRTLRFRVTCNRAGDGHSFTSMEVAREFGGAVQDHFGWKADMKNFDVEVLVNIHDQEMCVGIALTEESLHRRNITHFGPTTLRSTLAYGMLRLCSPQPGDIIIDPMCGTGAIPVECGMEWPRSFHIGGDSFPMATNRSVNNVNHLNSKRNSGGRSLPVDIVQWDVCRLPLKTASVDACVTDMPFGKRMGSRRRNWDLYPACLLELARVCRPGTGRAALLTQDKKCMSKVLMQMGHLWRKAHTVWVNVGGLHAGVFLLRRTAAPYDGPGPGHRERVAPYAERATATATATAASDGAGARDDGAGIGATGGDA